jgi:hypothetical protein
MFCSEVFVLREPVKRTQQNDANEQIRCFPVHSGVVTMQLNMRFQPFLPIGQKLYAHAIALPSSLSVSMASRGE